MDEDVPSGVLVVRVEDVTMADAPSIVIAEPVIGAASCEARYATSAAISSGRMKRERAACGYFARSASR